MNKNVIMRAHRVSNAVRQIQDALDMYDLSASRNGEKAVEMTWTTTEGTPEFFSWLDNFQEIGVQYTSTVEGVAVISVRDYMEDEEPFVA